MKHVVVYCETRVVGNRAAQSNDELSREVNAFALRPLVPEEYAVFTLDLCNNQIDRHYSQFPEDELEKINALVPGKPLMERHDVHGTLPLGTFFRSQIYQDDERGYVSVRPDVYILRTERNRDLIANIEGGVYRGTSIGFSFRCPECSVCGKDIRKCPHTPGEEYAGKLCYYVMHDVMDVLEGSIVFAGSQGTEFLSAGCSRGICMGRCRFSCPNSERVRKLGGIELGSLWPYAEEM